MYDHIDDILDVSYEELEFTETDFNTVEDTAVYAGDVVVIKFEHDADFDLSCNCGVTGEAVILDVPVTWDPVNSGSTFEAGIGVQIPETAEPNNIYHFSVVVADSGDSELGTIDIAAEVLEFNVMTFYLTLFLVLAVTAVILYFLLT